MNRAFNASRSGEAASTAEAPSTRWWESYLVRYFVGFIVGTVCVATVLLELGIGKVLGAYITVPVNSTLKPDWSAVLIGAALLGLGFCYIVSTPITVLHVGRYDRWIPDAHSRHFWFGWVGALVATGALERPSLAAYSGLRLSVVVVCLVLIWWLPVNSTLGGARLPGGWKKDAELRQSLQSRPIRLLIVQVLVWTLFIWSAVGALVSLAGRQLNETEWALWLLSAPVFWIGVMQYVVLVRLLTDTSGLEEFYGRLFSARRQKNAKDVRDTYTHLREHSNSVFIVVVELCVLASLLALKNVTGFGDQAERNAYGQVVLAGLAIWMLPTLFMWARANAIEHSFAYEPEKFLSDESKDL